MYDGETLASKRTINLPQPISEGWGLAHQTKNDKTKLFVTDGSYKVFVLDPETFEIEKTLEVFLLLFFYNMVDNLFIF